MVKLFRIVRQDSLTARRFGKYALYAAGEIVLVVIGILIAIQLNNWNENRKREARTQNLYYRLSKQILQNIDRTLSMIELLTQQVDGITTLMLRVGVPMEQYDQRRLDSTLLYSIMDYQLGLDLNTLLEARDNGELSSIKGDSLRVALYELSVSVDLIEQREVIANADNNSYMVPYFYKNTNMRNLHVNVSPDFELRIGSSNLTKTSYADLLMDREFENLLNTRLTYAEEMLMTYQNLKGDLEYTNALLGRARLKTREAG